MDRFEKIMLTIAVIITVGMVALGIWACVTDVDISNIVTTNTQTVITNTNTVFNTVRMVF